MIQIIKAVEQEIISLSKTFFFKNNPCIERVPISEIINDNPSKQTFLKIASYLILLKYFSSSDNHLRKECNNLTDSLVDTFNHII